MSGGKQKAVTRLSSRSSAASSSSSTSAMSCFSCVLVAAFLMVPAANAHAGKLETPTLTGGAVARMAASKARVRIALWRCTAPLAGVIDRHALLMPMAHAVQDCRHDQRAQLRGGVVDGSRHDLAVNLLDERHALTKDRARLGGCCRHHAVHDRPPGHGRVGIVG